VSRILIVDDEAELRQSIWHIVSRLGHETVLAGSGEEALDALRTQHIDLIVTDLRLPAIDGLELLRRARAASPHVEVIVMTAFGNVPLAVAAVKEGAYDFLSKPFSRADLERAVARALEHQQLASENRRLRLQLDGRAGAPASRIIGQSETIQRMLALVEQVAPSAANVLIEGESGTGKELVAETLHALSGRAAGPLVKVNCAAIPDTLLEAELFGHEKGAFTGALSRRDGRFATAAGGTLFLDEVATLSMPVQAKLLRVLQDGTFERLGSNAVQRADCRIVAATNVGLKRAVQDGGFRDDLYYRLNVISIRVPPLREREGDVPLLAQQFLADFAAKDHKPIESLSLEALAALSAYDWPGNVRELRHLIERAVVLARGRFIEVEHLTESVLGAARARVDAAASRAVIEVPVGTPLAEVERLLIDETLRRTGGNRKRAADMLGIAARTVYRKLAPPADRAQ